MELLDKIDMILEKIFDLEIEKNIILEDLKGFKDFMKNI